jgi:hypothetical protein
MAAAVAVSHRCERLGSREACNPNRREEVLKVDADEDYVGGNDAL